MANCAELWQKDHGSFFSHERGGFFIKGSRKHCSKATTALDGFATAPINQC
jgi:hypothetical protein